MSGDIPTVGIASKFAKASQPERSREIARPFCLRLTNSERARLEAEAGTTPLGRYIRARLLGAASQKRRKARRISVNEQALARAMAHLGQSRLASNLNQIAKAANIGALPVSPDLEGELAEACHDVRQMRQALITALGLREGSASPDNAGDRR
ncbi:MAG: hypothetical protein AAGD92_03250 [Pseudomonadota bacterium]